MDHVPPSSLPVRDAVLTDGPLPACPLCVRLTVHSCVGKVLLRAIITSATLSHHLLAMPGNSLDIGHGRPGHGKGRQSHPRVPSASLYDAFDAEQIKQFKEAFTVGF